MADEKKTEAKAKKDAKGGAGAAKAEVKAAGEAAAQTGETCRVEKCKQPVRAKGYCRKHFIGWRRGKVGADHRYKTCSKEACRKPRAVGGLCEEHAGIAPAAAPEGSAPAEA